MSRFKFVLIVLVSIILGMVSRPYLEALIPGAAAGKKMMPDIAELYGKAAKHDGPNRNPVIVVPGMMGSRLAQTSTGRVVWGAFTQDSIDPSVAEDVRLLSYPVEFREQDFDTFEDDVSATGVLDSIEINLAGLELSQQAYLNILRMLGVGGYRDEELGRSGAIDYGDKHFTCFQFPYDWRRDNAENARRLHEFILEKKAYLERERLTRFSSKEPVKFDIVAHSMGGLVSRYFLRYGNQGPFTNRRRPQLDWSGAEFVERLILIGTPNSGSAKSLKAINEGFQFSAFLSGYPAGMVSTMPSIYQLLPRDRDRPVVDSVTGETLDLYDVETWDRRGWGMLNPEQDDVLKMLMPKISEPQRRREIAKSHVGKCLERARSFHEALDLPATPPPGVSIHLFAGDATPTASRLSSNLAERSLEISARGSGDGTVTRKSALADQRTDDQWGPILQSPIQFRDIRFLFTDHFGLTRASEFTDNALYLLLEDPTKKQRR